MACPLLFTNEGLKCSNLNTLNDVQVNMHLSEADVINRISATGETTDESR